MMKSWPAPSAAGSVSGLAKQKGRWSADDSSLASEGSPRASSSRNPINPSELWTLKAKARCSGSGDDLRSLGETSSRSSSSSRTSTSSSSNWKSSRNSSPSSRSNSSSSSRSGSRSRRHMKHSCIRTLFRDEHIVEAPGLVRLDDYSTSASEHQSSSGSEPSSPLSVSPIQSSIRDYDRPQSERYEALWAEGSEVFEKSPKSSWRKLRHRRLLTNLFNFKSQSGSGFPGDEDPQSMLVDIHVLGSPGPIRLVVGTNESVQQVIELALQKYDTQKRQPVLGLSHQPFVLYCQTPEFEVMDERSSIGDYGLRHFYLYPKPESREEVDTSPRKNRGATNKSSSIRTWFEKSASEMQSWGICVLNTLISLGCLATSLSHLNFDSIMGAVLKALR